MKKILSLIGAVLIFAGVASAQYYTHDYKLTAPSITFDGNTTIDGTLSLPSTVVGENVFTTTAETDTVAISGALATDTYFVSGQFTSAIDQQDILQWEAIAGALVVHRMAAGESALKYSWLRIPTP